MFFPLRERDESDGVDKRNETTSVPAPSLLFLSVQPVAGVFRVRKVGRCVSRRPNRTRFNHIYWFSNIRASQATVGLSQCPANIVTYLSVFPNLSAGSFTVYFAELVFVCLFSCFLFFFCAISQEIKFSSFVPVQLL